MKTLEQVVKEYKSDTIDGRDLSRLAAFIPEAMLADLGITLKDEFVGKHEHKEFTRENIIEQLRKDVEFGFEKALSKRGISSGLMHDVVKMWNCILEDGLQHFEEYAQYGLPLFKATALKYGFPNPIGDDDGTEWKYSANGHH